MRMYVCRCLRMYIHMIACSACTGAGVGVRPSSRYQAMTGVATTTTFATQVRRTVQRSGIGLSDGKLQAQVQAVRVYARGRGLNAQLEK